MTETTPKTQPDAETTAEAPSDDASTAETDADEVGGPKGPEPTRFGDWERKGRCIDF